MHKEQRIDVLTEMPSGHYLDRAVLSNERFSSRRRLSICVYANFRLPPCLFDIAVSLFEEWLDLPPELGEVRVRAFPVKERAAQLGFEHLDGAR